MKTLILTLIVGLLFPRFMVGQIDENSIKMISEYSSENLEIREILAFERIDYYKIAFVGSKLIGKDYSLVVKEIWNGEIKTNKTLISSTENRRLEKLEVDSLEFKVMAKY